MKLKPGYNGKYYLYIKNSEDLLKESFMVNVTGIKNKLKQGIEFLIKETDELLLKYNNTQLLKDDYYTDGNNVYNKKELTNINNLLKILKNKPLFPVCDNMVINEPLDYNRVFYYVKNNLITNKYNLDILINRIVEDIFKTSLIENNKDKFYIYNDLGITINKNKPKIDDWFSYTSDYIKGEEVDEILDELETFTNNENEIDTIYLEEKYLADSITYSYYITEKINEEIGLKDEGLFNSVISDCFNINLNNAINIYKNTNIDRFAVDVELYDNIIKVYKFMPYSSLRAKVIKNLLGVENEFD